MAGRRPLRVTGSGFTARAQPSWIADSRSAEASKLPGYTNASRTPHRHAISPETRWCVSGSTVPRQEQNPRRAADTPHVSPHVKADPGRTCLRTAAIPLPSDQPLSASSMLRLCPRTPALTDRAIGAGIVRFAAERRDPSVRIPATRALRKPHASRPRRAPARGPTPESGRGRQRQAEWHRRCRSLHRAGSCRSQGRTGANARC